ncbi:oligosaccharide flippase family protein [Providencia rettgeri]|uniref:oligosaccharide flippase family protein n=1 Tax=Providencia TaxID=586 RepID=UPI00227114E0|nr:oligosaccharide flippase family protein [Providencia rettgeri]MCX9109974.1 oligosaccharide flippase family protein [Providencia rettgeri]
MSKKMPSLYKNIISLTFVQLITYLSPIIVLPYLSRVLELEFFGLTMIIMSIIIMSLLITDFGFNLYTPAWIAENKGNTKKVSDKISAIFILKIALYLPTSIVIILYFYLSDIPNDIKESLCIVTLIAILFQAFQIPWFFQGIERMLNITLLTFLSKVSYVFFIFLSVNEQHDILAVIISYAASNLITTIMSVILYYKLGYSLTICSSLPLMETLKNSFPFFVSRASVSIYTSASTMIIGSTSGLTQAALYSSAEKLYQAGQSISYPISQALYPYLARTKSILTFYKFIIILTPFLIGFITIIYSYSNEIIILFYGNEYAQSSNVLKVFLITTVVNFISVNFGYPAFSIINRLDIANKSVIYAGILQAFILFCLYLNSGITAINVAISILIVESFVMLVRIFYFVKISRGLK